MLGGKRVSTIRLATPKSSSEVFNETEVGSADGEGNTSAQAGASLRVETTDGDVFEPDAVILAVGITAAKVRLLWNRSRTLPSLSSSGVERISRVRTRIWLAVICGIVRVEHPMAEVQPC